MNVIDRMLIFSAFSCCWMNVASAAQEGLFTYEIVGASVTITDYPDNAVGPVVVPSSIAGKAVTVIEATAFNEVVGMTSVIIPSTVTTIGLDAFALCSGLVSVTLPSSVTSIGSTAFKECIALTSITIPAGVTIIEESLFEGCTSLGNLEIPLGVTAIRPRAFAGCSGLVGMVIPFGVTVIENSIFENCDGLTNVSIPASVSSIENYAFFDCDSLAGVMIPASVISLGNGVFSDGALLRSVVFLGNAPSMGDTVFNDQGTNPNLRVYFFDGKSGFTAPSWLPVENQPPFASVNMGPENPLTAWLISYNLPTNSNLQDDANNDGVNLLMAYALSLDPSKNLSGSLPKPVLNGNQMTFSFYGTAPGVSYSVECSTTLATWSTEGVTLSAPNINQMRTATVSTTGPSCFMRLKVSQ